MILFWDDWAGEGREFAACCDSGMGVLRKQTAQDGLFLFAPADRAVFDRRLKPAFSDYACLLSCRSARLETAPNPYRQCRSTLPVCQSDCTASPDNDLRCWFGRMRQLSMACSPVHTGNVWRAYWLANWRISEDIVRLTRSMTCIKSPRASSSQVSADQMRVSSYQNQTWVFRGLMVLGKKTSLVWQFGRVFQILSGVTPQGWACEINSVTHSLLNKLIRKAEQ